MLRRSRRACLLLADLAIVARAVPATEENLAAATRELQVARYLAERGAPVVGPIAVMPADPVIADGWAVTLWPHVAHRTLDDDDEPGLNAAARALRHVHDVLADYPGELPSYWAKVEGCAALLRRPLALPGLAAEDQVFLVRAHERLTDAAAATAMQLAPIHGDAHPGNVLIAPCGPLWTDFEAVCRGPREWDAAGMGDLPAFRPLDPEVLRVMAELRSLCVVVWCSTPDADADQRAAAALHLARLRAGSAML